MITIIPKPGLLLIKKHKKTGIKADMIIEEMDEDKRLITGEVLCNRYVEPSLLKYPEKNSQYPVGTTVIFGKYALFPLTLQGKEIFFLDENDVLGTCDYKE